MVFMMSCQVKGSEFYVRKIGITQIIILFKFACI